MDTLTNLLIPEVKEMIEAKDTQGLKSIFDQLAIASVAEVVSELEDDDKEHIFSLLNEDTVLDIFPKLHTHDRQILLDSLPEKKISRIINTLPDDERTRFLEEEQEINPHEFREMISLLSEEERKVAWELLSYPEDSAGRAMTEECLKLHPDTTVDEAISYIRAHGPDKETIYYCYIVDDQEKLIGFVDLKTLLLSDSETPISEIMLKDVISVHTHDDQETVARLIQRHGFLAMPVVNEENKLLGIVTIDDMIGVIEHEDTEDFYKLSAAGEQPDEYLNASALSIARQRVTWLLVLVFTGFISGFIMEKYSPTIQAIVALAFYIPLLMDTGGNAGTQTTTVVVRSLATGQIKPRNALKVVRKELAIGILMGIAMGILAAGRALVAQESARLGLAVCLAMICAVSLATVLGGLLPIFFKKIGLDPAVTSGPFITSIMDISVLIIYFEIARRILTV